MPSVQSVGGKSIVVPMLEMDIDLEAEDAEDHVHANWEELQAAFTMAGRFDGQFDGNNGTVLLPAGTIHATGPNGTGLSNIMLDERHAGITIQGAGRAKTLIVDPLRSVPQIQISSRRISLLNGGTFLEDDTTATITHNPELYVAGDVLFFWNSSEGPGRTVELQRVVVVSVSGDTVTFTPALTSNWNVFRHFKGHAVTGELKVGDDYLTVTDPAFLTEFRVNDDIMISDGPAINETYAEWATVTEVDNLNARIFFTPPLRQAYAAGLTCVLPAPHMTDITLRDLAIAAPRNNEIRYMGFIRIGRRIRLENVDFVPDGEDIVAVNHGPLDVATCGEVAFVHCSIFGPSFTASHDGFLQDVRARGFGFSEFCFDFDCSNITIDGGNFVCQDSFGFGPCQRIHLRDCLALSYCASSIDPGVSFVKGSRISNVRLTNALGDAPIYFNDENIVLQNVTFDKDVYVFSRIMLVDQVAAPRFQLQSDDGSHPEPSSGVIITSFFDSSSSPAGMLVDASPAGQWLRPLLVAKDGTAKPPQVLVSPSSLLTPGLKLPSPGDDIVPLTVQGAHLQTADLQQWKNEEGDTLFAIRADGHLASANIEEEEPPNKPIRRLEIFDENGTSMGFIPIYAEES